MALTNAEKQRRHRERQKEKNLAAAAELHDPLFLELQRLIAEAQAIAIELNQRAVAKLKAAPLTRETARQLEALDGKITKVNFASYIP
jgi:hypothetical protein